MKRLLQTLLLILAAQAVFAQQPCQAAFTYNGSNTGYIQLYDASYNLDSTPITVIAWDWTVQYGGANYTYTMANPIVQTGGYSGPITICLTIATSLGCSSTMCDTINTNTQQPCHADFTWLNNGLLYSYNFQDQSTAGNYGASIIAWYWTISDNLQNTLYTTTLQNMSFTFPGTGTYHVCLTIATDSGCTSNQCYYVTVIDSNQQNCQLTVTPVVSNVTIMGGSDGFIDLTVSGGTPPYTFIWSNGATTEDINNLSAGVYTVSIGQSNINCPAVSYSFQILDPNNTIPQDTLWATIDTCFNFNVDTFFISNIQVVQNLVYVTWVFEGNGITETFTVSYIYNNYGVYIAALTINCAKSSVTYMSPINITSTAGIAEIQKQKILIYPNPVTGIFRLDIPGSPGNDIRIYNSMGQMIFFGKTVSTSTSIDASQWPAGIYLVRVKDITRNIVKQ